MTTHCQASGKAIVTYQVNNIHFPTAHNCIFTLPVITHMPAGLQLGN